MTSAPEGLERWWSRIDANRLERLLIRAVETYSPSFAEEPAMELLEEALNAAGLPYLRQPVAGRAHGDDHGNLIVQVGAEPPALLWVGHVDTVAPEAEEQLTARRDGDLVYGLGSADMKAGCCAVVEALIAMAESGVLLSRGFAAAFVVGEEEYGDGARALVQRMGAPLTVIGEPSSLAPCLGHHGYREFRLESRGSRVHAALPELGANAIHAMLAWLTALEEESRAAAATGQLAVSPRDISGGGALFVVAERCQAHVDIHFSPEFDPAAVDEVIRVARERAAASHPDCSLESTCLFSAAGYRLADDSPRIRSLRRAYAHAGIEFAPTTFRSHSDANLLHEAGSEPVVCGPGDLAVAHTRHEHVSLEEVRRAARLYAAMAWEVCGGRVGSAAGA
jgi:acetylornithine deacetylase